MIEHLIASIRRLVVVLGAHAVGNFGIGPRHRTNVVVQVGVVLVGVGVDEEHLVGGEEVHRRSFLALLFLLS